MMKALPRIVLLFVFIALAVAARTKNPVEMTLEKGESLYEAGKLVAAGACFRKVLFAKPGDHEATKRLRKIDDKLSDALVKEADDNWENDRQTAIEILQRAAEIDPHGEAVRKAYHEHGYTFHQGQWLTKDEIQKYATSDHSRGDQRRRQLHLSKKFKIIRQDPFRFFTDAPPNAQKVQEMMSTCITHFHAYCRVMEPLGLHYPEQGLDVVLFSKEADYLAMTKVPDRLGVYIPSTEASYFFITGKGEDYSTLMHEMTHQLNDKVLQMVDLPACLEEGSAEYFGHSKLTNGGRTLRVGQPYGEDIQILRDVFCGREQKPCDLRTFLTVPSPQGDTFYPFAWGLVYYLMQAPKGRLIIFDAFANAKYQPEVRGDQEKRSFEEILSSYGMSLDEFKKGFRDYYVNLH